MDTLSSRGNLFSLRQHHGEHSDVVILAEQLRCVSDFGRGVCGNGCRALESEECAALLTGFNIDHRETCGKHTKTYPDRDRGNRTKKDERERTVDLSARCHRLRVNDWLLGSNPILADCGDGRSAGFLCISCRVTWASTPRCTTAPGAIGLKP